jgi:hypothetical protein
MKSSIIKIMINILKLRILMLMDENTMAHEKSSMGIGRVRIIKSILLTDELRLVRRLDHFFPAEPCALNAENASWSYRSGDG